ncbi:MAG: hypothetical protein H0U57_04335 [Tatlockia sp.]|nr:hypothetical protein [Tatlockia sp.]
MPLFDAEINHLTEIYKLISEEKSLEAIEQIKSLYSQTTLDKAQDKILELFHYKNKKDNLTLCEWAIEKGNLEVANAIISLYPNLQPLTIDFGLSDLVNFKRSPSLISFESLDLYKYLVKDQRETYCDEILAESKELRIKAVKDLIDLVLDNPIKNTLLKSLINYINNSYTITDLNQSIEKALQSYRKDAFDSLKTLNPDVSDKKFNKLLEENLKADKDFAKINGAFHTVNSLDKIVNDYKDLPGKSLAEFKQNTKRALESHKDILQSSRGYGELIASIGNALMRFTGVGFVIAGIKGKYEDYKHDKWRIFSEQTKSAEKQENLDAAIESLPTPKK